MGRPVDALALNAGVGLGGPFVEQPVEGILNLVNLNVRSVVHLARLLLPAMVARRQGRVLVTSSIAALMPGPFEAVYGASKAFELSWAQAVRNELKDSGVTVTALQPGPTDTEFFHRAGMDDTKVGADEKDEPAKVARQGFEAMMAGRDHVVAGALKNTLQAAASTVLPNPALAQMHRGMSEPGTASK
jgi:short-subunit dehydrogenase